MRTGEVVATADDWSTDPIRALELEATFRATGAFAWEYGSADAALSITLAPGAYTVVATGDPDSVGVALIEVYDDP